MDQRIKTAKKKMDNQMNALLKEDKKIDKKHEKCEHDLKKAKKK